MNETYSIQYPKLHNLLCGYFNYDWDLDYPTWEAAIEDVIANNLPPDGGYIKSLVLEIDDVLQRFSTKDALEEFFDAIDSGIYPINHGFTDAEWLLEIRKRFTDALLQAGGVG